VIPGHLNHSQLKVMHWNLNEPHTDDVLDDMLQLALTKGTSVYILEKKCPLLCTAARLKIYKGTIDKTYTLLYNLNLSSIASSPTYFDITTIAITDFNRDGKNDFIFFEKFSQKVSEAQSPEQIKNETALTFEKLMKQAGFKDVYIDYIYDRKYGRQSFSEIEWIVLIKEKQSIHK
jgi:hypothetical protein